MFPTQIWIVMKQSTNLELNEPIDEVVMNVKELTHSQQQPQVPKTHKKKPTIRQAIRTVFCALQRSLPYRFLVLDEVKCKKHTQQSTSSKETYGGSGSDVKHIEDFSKGENKKNSKEYDYTITDVKKDRKQADLQETKIMRYHHDILRKKVKMRKLWSQKKWGWDTSEKTFL